MAADFGVFVVMIITNILHDTGYLNFINDPISRVLLLILVHVLLLSCPYFRPLASLRLKTMLLNTVQHFMKGMVKIYFGPLKTSDEIRNKFKSKDFLASILSIYDFSTLYTTLPHNLIEEKLT